MPQARIPHPGFSDTGSSRQGGARRRRLMIIRREAPDDVTAISEVTAAAFRGVEHSVPPGEPGGPPVEVDLIDRLRADDGWIPELSLVAESDGVVVGHVLGSRAIVGEVPAIGLGPLSVAPGWQRSGVGAALMHAVLGAAEALDEQLVGLLGDPAYYSRFGFVSAESVGVTAPDAAWGAYFQVRSLSAYRGDTGAFRYAVPFDAV